MGDGPQALAPSAVTSVLWGLSYVFWRRLQATSGEGLTAHRGVFWRKSAGEEAAAMLSAVDAIFPNCYRTRPADGAGYTRSS